MLNQEADISKTPIRGAYITGIGSYLPERVLSNHDLEKMVETTDEWIVTRTGMKERRIAASDEYTSHMGAEAAKRALDSAAIRAEEIELIIVATLTPDYTFPSTACLIQHQIGATKAAAFDLHAACTGYIYVLTVAKAFIESGLYKNILVIASDKLSSIIDYSDRNTCVLFGDGAAAAVIRSQGPGLKLGQSSLGSDGSESGIISMAAGGSRQPASFATVEAKAHYLRMDGKAVFKHAVRHMEAESLSCMAKMGLKEGDISYLVPHQANLRIIDVIAKRCAIPDDKVIKTIDYCGNTSASSVGIALDILMKKGEVEDQNHLLLVAFGAGLTWGSIILTMESKVLCKSL